jgi:hypothetical protein
MVGATALLEKGGGRPGDESPESIRRGDDAGQRADSAATHSAQHDQDGRDGTHDADHSCSSRWPLIPYAMISTSMIISCSSSGDR